MKICIEARLNDGDFGGCQQVVIGLAAGLSKLTDGDEEYLFVVKDPGGSWLTPYVSGPCRTIPIKGPPPIPERGLRAMLKRVRPLRQAVVKARALIDTVRPVPAVAEDDLPIRLGASVMHFPFQFAFPTKLPSIYHPHDLQHRHLPQYFTRNEIRVREVNYRRNCERAALVAVTSTWVKNDLVAAYQLPPEKIAVIPLAPVLDHYPTPTDEDLAATKKRLGLPDQFVLYPAQTWPHKNHLNVLRAMVELRNQGAPPIPFVFSGRKNEFYSTIEGAVRRDGLGSLVNFVGFVSPLDLACLYRLARCTVIATKFEAASFPLWEAFSAGVPAACSTVTSLPAQAGDAALLFDPDQPREIAACVRRLWEDADLRRTLAARGAASVARFTWERTARTFRAHYRRLAQRPLTEEDVGLMSAAPIL